MLIFIAIEEESQERTWFKLDEVGSFIVQVGFMSTCIHIKKAGKGDQSPFIQKLVKDRKGTLSVLSRLSKIQIMTGHYLNRRQ